MWIQSSCQGLCGYQRWITLVNFRIPLQNLVFRIVFRNYMHLSSCNPSVLQSWKIRTISKHVTGLAGLITWITFGLRHYCDLLCLPSWTQTDCVPTWLFHDHKVRRKFTLRTEHHHLVFGSYSTQLPKWLRTPTLLKQIPAHGLVASNATAQNQLQEATGHNHSRYSALICLKLNEIMCHFLQWRVNQGGRDLESQDSDQTTCLGTPGNHNMWGLGVLRRITCAHLHSIWIVSVL